MQPHRFWNIFITPQRNAIPTSSHSPVPSVSSALGKSQTRLGDKQQRQEIDNGRLHKITAKTAGHGQFERVWYSSNKNGGNVYISIILKPDNIEHLNELTRYVALIGA